MISRLAQLFHRALSKSETILKIDTAYLIKGSFWLTIGQIAATGTGFLVATAFANFATQEVYGNYKYALSLISTLTLFTLPGINSAIATAVATGKEGNFLPAISKKIRWGFLGSIVSLGVAFYFYQFESNRGLAISFIITAFFLPFMDSVGLYNTYLQSKKLFQQSITYFVTSQLLATLCLLLAIIYGKRLNIILLTYFIAWTSLRLFFLLRTIHKHPPNSEINEKTESYGNHLSFVGVLGNLTTYLDSLLLFHYLGPLEVAIYNIAIAPPEQIRGLSKNIPSLALPKLAQRSFKEIKSVLRKRLWWLFWVGLISAVAYYFIAPYLFGIFFKRYAASILYSQIYAFTLVIRLPLSLFNTAMQSKLLHQPKRWLYYGTVSQLILIICLLIFTYLYGIMGALLSRFIGFAVSYLITWWQWRLLLKLHNE